MQRKVEFVGGPHDGLKLSTGLGDTFIWTNGRKCFRVPARARVLYRASGDPRMSVITTYRYVGLTHGLCSCGAYRKRAKPCQMCGSAVLLG